jgi:hypothetical protein
MGALLALKIRGHSAQQTRDNQGNIDQAAVADAMVSDIPRLFFGLEIQPFAAYLAELDLLT